MLVCRSMRVPLTTRQHVPSWTYSTMAANQHVALLHCPNGYGKSKLTTAYFDSKLATTCTVRNWRTVLALRDML